MCFDSGATTLRSATSLAGADLVAADGMPLLWAGGLQGSPLPERVAGSTLIVSLNAAAAQADASIFLLGGNPGRTEAAVEQLKVRTPGLRLAGTLCPPYGFEKDPDFLDRLEQRLHDASPDIVCVALGFPHARAVDRQVARAVPKG